MPLEPCYELGKFGPSHLENISCLTSVQTKSSYLAVVPFWGKSGAGISILISEADYQREIGGLTMQSRHRWADPGVNPLKGSKIIIALIFLAEKLNVTIFGVSWASPQIALPEARPLAHL